MNEGIQSIISHIDSDAVSHSFERLNHLKNATDREIERENAAFLSDLEQRKEILLAHHAAELRHRLERHSRRLNRDLLTYRRELLDEIFGMAVRELSEISADEYADIFRAATADLRGSYTLHIGELSQDKLSTDNVNEAVKSNNGLEIQVSRHHIPGRSGFVIRDDRVEYNYLFEDLIEDKKSEQSAMILKEVFADCE